MDRNRNNDDLSRQSREETNNNAQRRVRRPYGPDGHYQAGLGHEPDHVPDYYRYGDSPTRLREGRSYEGAPSGYQHRYSQENRYGYYGPEHRPKRRNADLNIRGYSGDRDYSRNGPAHYGYRDEYSDERYNDLGMSDNLAGYYGRNYTQDDADLWPEQRKEDLNDEW